MLLPYLNKGVIEAGCDEAGRGCLAGPVFAAAVILPYGFEHAWLNDSKQLTEKQRVELRPLIESQALGWGIGIVDADEIDRVNILNASILAMHRALWNLTITPEHLLIDGNRFRTLDQLPLHKLPVHQQPDRQQIEAAEIPYTCIIKGDGTYLSIAAASVLAKTYRDDFMDELDKQYPEYNWKQNKGYPTEAHRKVLQQIGRTNLHRKSFHLKEDQLSLDF